MFGRSIVVIGLASSLVVASLAQSGGNPQAGREAEKPGAVGAPTGPEADRQPALDRANSGISSAVGGQNRTLTDSAPAQNRSVGIEPGLMPSQIPTEPPPVAPNFAAPLRPLPPPERVGVDVRDPLPLTLRDAIAMALRNNNDIDGSRINVEIAEYALRAARGAYDPVLAMEHYFERRTTPTSSTIGGGANGILTQTDTTGSFTLNGLSPFGGGSYEFTFNSSRLTTNNQFATLNPQYPSVFTFTYTQPLWRGFRFDNNRRQIEIAKRNLSLSDAQFRQRVIDVITQVEQAYWDLVFALRNLQVQIDALKQARTQVESNERLVEKGVLAPIDIVAAQTQVATFEQNVYAAQESVTRAENSLKTLILRDRLSPLWSRAITPITPVDLNPPTISLEQAVADALKNRPEIAQLQASAEINEIDVRYYRDQTKPQIDLVGTYTSNGLAGARVPTVQSPRGTSPELITRVNDISALLGLPPLQVSSTGTTSTINPSLVGGYFTSLAHLLGQDYPTYHVGVRISLPLRNRTAEANLGRALAQGRVISRQRAQLEQTIESDVRNALQALRSAQARLTAAAAARRSAELQYESEQRQLRAGTTTVFLVLQRQTDLVAARGRELQAQIDLNKAIAEFQRATGITLSAHNVSILRDGAGGHPTSFEVGSGDGIEDGIFTKSLFEAHKEGDRARAEQ
ncbi:MAG: TolC family protein [Pyrinomonas methylaliphatogenes]|nr:TolC family protein [Pyrinomonas methylaliphatogenes]